MKTKLVLELRYEVEIEQDDLKKETARLDNVGWDILESNHVEGCSGVRVIVRTPAGKWIE